MLVYVNRNKVHHKTDEQQKHMGDGSVWITKKSMNIAEWVVVGRKIRLFVCDV